jgi:hypothetical protein
MTVQCRPRARRFDCGINPAVLLDQAPFEIQAASAPTAAPPMTIPVRKDLEMKGQNLRIRDKSAASGCQHQRVKDAWNLTQNR